MSFTSWLLDVRPANPGELQITEELGPRGRRRALLGTIGATALLLGGLAWVIRRFQVKGQFEGELWAPFKTWAIWKYLLLGLGQTLKAAGIALVFTLAFGIILAAFRSDSRPVRRVFGTVITEFLRSCALVLLITFLFFQLPKTPGFRGWTIGSYALVSVVAGLTFYYSAVMAEVIRSGIRSLPKGQTEAAMAIGLTEGKTMRLVILPQALRRALPNIFTQAATLLKDTSLGVFVTYSELLSRAKIVGEFGSNQLQSFIVAGGMYITAVAILTATANRLQRQRRTA